MNAVESYIQQLPPAQQSVAESLHLFIMAQPGVRCCIRYKIPFYDRHSMLCYLNPKKKSGVELVFVQGHLLSNEQGLLQSRGRTQVSGVIFEKPEEIPFETLTEILQEVLLLDEIKPYAGPRR